jgi:hypothetical protein
MEINAFQVYGDNLGECQKFCELLIEFGAKFGLKFDKLVGHIDRPIYLFEYEDLKIGLLPCGRYKDWKRDRRPYIGYEDPDIILCHVLEPNKVGKPILGIEFNDAIEAGNNAWQRVPRIVQAAEKGIPFIYSIPICDAEVKDGKIKSFRHPNVIIQIAQLILMAENNALSLTTYTESPWYESASNKGIVCPNVLQTEGEKNLAQIAGALIIESSKGKLKFNPLSASDEGELLLRKAFGKIMENMLYHISYFISRDFSLLDGHPIFERANFSEVIEIWWRKLLGKDQIPPRYRFYEWEVKNFVNFSLPFKKATSTNSIYKNQINPVMSRLGAWSYKKGANEIAVLFDPPAFAGLLNKAYPSLEKEVIDHLLESKEPILFLPIAGYVMDTGGPSFSRPDKGLVGLMRTVFGKKHIFSRRIVLLYSQLVPDNWKNQISEAKTEDRDLKSGQTNNLWREIIQFATAVIVDKEGSGVLV